MSKDNRPGKSAVWCGILQADDRRAAVVVETRTVRGLLSTFHEPQCERPKARHSRDWLPLQGLSKP